MILASPMWFQTSVRCPPKRGRDYDLFIYSTLARHLLGHRFGSFQILLYGSWIQVSDILKFTQGFLMEYMILNTWKIVPVERFLYGFKDLQSNLGRWTSTYFGQHIMIWYLHINGINIQWTSTYFAQHILANVNQYSFSALFWSTESRHQFHPCSEIARTIFPNHWCSFFPCICVKENDPVVISHYPNGPNQMWLAGKSPMYPWFPQRLKPPNLHLICFFFLPRLDPWIVPIVRFPAGSTRTPSQVLQAEAKELKAL